MDSPAEIFTDWLATTSCKKVFGVPGLQIDPLWFALNDHPDFELICATHEASAGFMADGYARQTRNIGVCLTIGSVGLANLAVAILAAKTDHTPILFITGEAPLHIDGHGPFQDTSEQGSSDQAWVAPLVKASIRINSIASMRTQLEQAREHALAYPPGPVHISIPYGELPESWTHEPTGWIAPAKPINDDGFDEALHALARAQRIVALIGDPQLCPDRLKNFVETFTIPTATTLAAKGLLPDNHPLCLGNFGYAGYPDCNQRLIRNDYDTLLLLGADMNERNTLNWRNALFEGKQLIAIGSWLMGKEPSRTTVTSHGNPLQFLTAAQKHEPLRKALNSNRATRLDWLKRSTPNTGHATKQTPAGELAPQSVITTLRTLPDETLLFTDAGTSRIIAGTYWEARQPDTFHSCASTGAMGWSLGAAIGGGMARPDLPLVILIGDGSLLMYGNELATIAKLKLPAMVVLLNNNSYGSIYSRSPSAINRQHSMLPPVNWSHYAKALGVTYLDVRQPHALSSAVDSFHEQWRNKRAEPVLIDLALPLGGISLDNQSGYSVVPYQSEPQYAPAGSTVAKPQSEAPFPMAAYKNALASE